MDKEKGFQPSSNKDFIISDSSVVKAEDVLLPLCSMCKKSRLTCENIYIREVEIKMTEYDNPNDEVIGSVKQPDGTYITQGLGIRSVDGVEAGLIKTEDDVPIPVVCDWFELKDLG